MDRMSLNDNASLSTAKPELILSVRNLGPSPGESFFKQRVAKIVPPAELFGSNPYHSSGISAEVRGLQDEHGENILQQRSRKIPRALAIELYNSCKERKVAVKMVRASVAANKRDFCSVHLPLHIAPDVCQTVCTMFQKSVLHIMWKCVLTTQVQNFRHNRRNAGPSLEIRTNIGSWVQSQAERRTLVSVKLTRHTCRKTYLYGNWTVRKHISNFFNYHSSTIQFCSLWSPSLCLSWRVY